MLGVCELSQCVLGVSAQSVCVGGGQGGFGQWLQRINGLQSHSSSKEQTHPGKTTASSLVVVRRWGGRTPSSPRLDSYREKWLQAIILPILYVSQAETHSALV